MKFRALLLAAVTVSGFGSGQVLAGVTATEVTSESVTLSWTAVGDDGSVGTAAAYDIRYATFPITTASWSSATHVIGEPTPQSAGSPESYTVNGLEPATTYYFAIVVADERNNLSPMSNVVQQTTLQETSPPADIADLNGTSSAPGEVTLSWTAPGDDGNTGTASQYDIRYSTSTIDMLKWSSATQVGGESTPKAAGSDETITVTGLSTDVTYYFAIRTADEVPNWSGLSNVASVSTQNETTPPATIADLFITGAASTSLVLVWTAPGDDGNSGTANQYDIRYSTTNINSSNWSSALQLPGEPAPGTAGTVESVTVTNLNPDTRYYFAIKTADEVPNWSAMSNVASGITGAETTPPAAIANLGAGNETHNSIELTWTAPGDDGNSGQAAEYDIRYSTAPITSANFNSATSVGDVPAPAVAGTAESFVVTGLDESTTYYFAIKTADEVPNWSPISNVASRATTTDRTPPAAIDDLQASTGPGGGEVTLDWTAPGDDGGIGQVAGYDIRFLDEPISESNWSRALAHSAQVTPLPAGEVQTVQLSGLSSGELYYFAVRAYDESSNLSGLSNPAWAEAGMIFSTGDGTAELVSPPAGAEVMSSRPVLTVANSEPQADDAYEFEVSTDSTFVELTAVGLTAQEEGPTTCWKVDSRLANNTTYFWHARPMGGEYSEVSYFTVRPQTHAYPNPFDSDVDQQVTFTDIPTGGDLVVTTLSGNIVKQWSQVDSDEILWDGLSDDGARLASGMYLWYVSNSDQKGKLVVVR